MVVVLAGLAGANVTTYIVVRGFLLDRIDDQLVQAADPISREIDRQRNTTPYPDGTYPYPQREGSRDRGIPPTSFPPGTYGEIRNADGTSSSLVLGFGTSYAPPKLPEELDISEATFLSVDATDGSFRYRVLARTISDGRVLFTAVPMTSVDQTMNDLRTTSLGVSAAVVLVVAALALWLVRLGLRPLDSMAVTAGEIAAGNLTRRVEHTDNRTEVGRLGTALNQMLASLEEAFAEQKASEEQLRRFVADASHELRTPLTSIRGYAELFRRGADQRPEDLAKVMRRVDEESARMSVLVEELLLLARLNQAAPRSRAGGHRPAGAGRRGRRTGGRARAANRAGGAGAGVRAWRRSAAAAGRRQPRHERAEPHSGGCRRDGDRARGWSEGGAGGGGPRPRAFARGRAARVRAVLSRGQGPRAEQGRRHGARPGDREGDCGSARGQRCDAAEHAPRRGVLGGTARARGNGSRAGFMRGRRASGAPASCAARPPAGH
ncbi:MAG: HAMP domain-containing histidine kinase [Thermoflexaceae bacterium]|nr:HAMP domain-containing histidine kinase [Thermoflexaceae bacterium]